MKSQIELDVRSTLADQAAPGGLDIVAIVQSLSEKMASRLEQVVLDTQDKMTSLTEFFPAGSIELNNHNNLEKMVQLYILISSIKAPGAAAEDKLFKRFSATDLASILHLHFRAFKDKKFNTVQVKITECSDRLKINNPKVQKLSNALESFFY